MTVVDFEPAATQELNEHRRSFMTFERMVVFAVMHMRRPARYRRNDRADRGLCDHCTEYRNMIHTRT